MGVWAYTGSTIFCKAQLCPQPAEFYPDGLHSDWLSGLFMPAGFCFLHLAVCFDDTVAAVTYGSQVLQVFPGHCVGVVLFVVDLDCPIAAVFTLVLVAS